MVEGTDRFPGVRPLRRTVVFNTALPTTDYDGDAIRSSMAPGNRTAAADRRTSSRSCQSSSAASSHGDDGMIRIEDVHQLSGHHTSPSVSIPRLAANRARPGPVKRRAAKSTRSRAVVG